MKALRSFGKWILLIIVIAIDFYLYTLPEKNYWKYFYVPFKDGLNICIIGWVVYYFVEYKNDRRAKKKFLENLCNRIISRLEDVRMHHICDADTLAFVKIRHRIIFNEIYLLEKEAGTFNYHQEAEYIKDNLNEYWDLVSDNITNIEEMQKIEPLLHNKLALLINKTETISLKLYE